jgi:hypothetical protein
VKDLEHAGCGFHRQANLDELADTVGYFGSVRKPWARSPVE